MKPIVALDIETTGLHPWQGDKITCICAKDSSTIFNEVVTKENSESQLLQHFMHWLFERRNHMLLTIYGTTFDLPFIMTRLTMLDFDFNKYLFMMDMEHTDLKNTVKKWLSLNDYAKILNLPSKSGNGLNAIKLWEDGQYKVLARYCENDVLLTEAVYLKMLSLSGDSQ